MVHMYVFMYVWDGVHLRVCMCCVLCVCCGVRVRTLILVRLFCFGVQADPGIATTDLLGFSGYTSTDCVVQFGGSSASCAQVS